MRYAAGLVPSPGHALGPYPEACSTTVLPFPRVWSRSRNSVRTQESQPGSLNSRWSTSFQSIGLRTASAACRSVECSMNCITRMKPISRGMQQTGQPVETRQQTARRCPAFAISRPCSRERLVFGCKRCARCAVSSGIGGMPGCHDMDHSVEVLLLRF